MSLPQVSGVFPVIPAIYQRDGSVDPEAVRRVTRFAMDSGAHGIVFPGLASEVGFLNLEERAALVDAVGKEMAGRPFIVGASADRVEDAVRMMESGARAGATSAMIMAPASVGAEVTALVDFFGAIAAQSSLPIVMQNAPQPMGSGLAVETCAEVARQVPAIAYVKEEALPPGPRITALRSAAPSTLLGVIGGGGARHLYDELDRGAVAAMPAVEITDIHVALYKAFTSGDLARARQLYIRTLPLLLVQMTYRMRLTKQILMLRGLIDNPAVRAPGPEFDAKGLEELKLMLDELSDLTVNGSAK